MPKSVSLNKNYDQVLASFSQLMGFEHAVFVHSGTAALELALSVLADPGKEVAIPALGCWTIPHAIEKCGMVPVFCDIDSWWGIENPPSSVKVVVSVDPWSSAGNWTSLSNTKVRVLDATLSPGANIGGHLAGEFFDAAVLSLGNGKPIDIGAGGVVLFKEREAALEARKYLRFGFFNGRWLTRTERFVFSPHLLPVLARKLKYVDKALEKARRDAQLIREAVAKRLTHITTNPIRPGSQPGLGFVLPIVWDSEMGLTSKEIEAPALMHGFPLMRHPVSVAYREPAWSTRSSHSCLRAETLSDRLLFLELKGSPLRRVEALSAFFEMIMARREFFKQPYQLPEPHQAIPSQFSSWKNYGRACRAPNGLMFVYDERCSRAYKVPEEIAASVQNLELSRGY